MLDENVAGSADRRPGLIVIEIGHSIALRYAGRFLASNAGARVYTCALGANAHADTPLDHWLGAQKAPLPSVLPDGAILLLVEDCIESVLLQSAMDAVFDRVPSASSPRSVVTLRNSSPELCYSDLLLSAKSGAAWPSGESGRTPLYGIGHRLQYGIGFNLVIAGLAALGASASDARMTHATVDALGVAFGFLDQHSSAAAYSGADYRRNGTAGAHKHPSRIYGSGEKAFIIYCVRDEEWFRLADMTGLSGTPQFANMQTEAQRLEHAQAIDAFIEAWIAERSSEEIMSLVREYRVPVAPAYTPEAALALARNLLSEAEKQLALSPALRETSGSAFQTDLKFPDLRTLRVVEMSTGWSMPLVGRILAKLGAEVIKVESESHFDSWRGSRTVTSGLHRYPDGKLPADPINANSAFNVENVGKLSAALNLKHPRGTELALKLLSAADLFIENHRPGALTARGLGRDAVAHVSSGIGFLSISACGNGAGKDLVGWGPTVEAIAGMTALMGYKDTQYLNTGYAIVDPLSGMLALALLLTAMTRPEQNSSVDISMLQAALECFPEPFIDSRWNQRLENGHPYIAPHGIYPTAQADVWIALLCSSEAHWLALKNALQLHDAPGMDDFAASERRTARSAELDEIISKKTALWSQEELVSTLQAAGIPVARVVSSAEVLNDPEAHAAGYVSRTNHPLAGVRLQPDIAITPDWKAGRLRNYAPRLGEDNAYVWRQIAGLDAEAYAALVADGAIR